jgi:hypothetical protein
VEVGDLAAAVGAGDALGEGARHEVDLRRGPAPKLGRRKQCILLTKKYNRFLESYPLFLK